MSQIKKTAILNALLTAAYVIGVAIFMYWGGTMKIGRSNSFLIPISFLMLFVFSASLTGYLIFGKPVQMYIDGRKKEAVSVLLNTLLVLAGITFVALVLLLFFGR